MRQEMDSFVIRHRVTKHATIPISKYFYCTLMLGQFKRWLKVFLFKS